MLAGAALVIWGCNERTGERSRLVVDDSHLKTRAQTSDNLPLSDTLSSITG